MEQQNTTHAFRPARTETQKALLEIWKEVLPGNDFDIDDNFFEVGGDSLLSAQLYDIIKNVFNLESLQLEFTAIPTIRSLAAIIDERKGAIQRFSYRSLRMIQKGDPSVAPLFMVHGGTGIVRMFKLLSDQLDPRIPVYAFRWTGWDGRRGDKSLCAMAETYKEELLQFRPTGSFRIGGYCIGGLVALEMARLFSEEGVEIDGPVYIWDSPNVRSISYRIQEPWYAAADHDEFKRMGDQVNHLRQTMDKGSLPIEIPEGYSGGHEILHRFPFLYAIARGLQIFIAMIPIRTFLLLGKRLPVKWRWAYCMATNYFALRRHASKKYHGSVIYLRSGTLLGRPMNLLGWWSDPFLGFGELCSGEFHGYVVGGDHVDLLAEPFGGEIVNKTYFKDD